ncbi:MAG: tripartite tricarboxylate transporter permease, partial [Planctomycetaceae bacterium]
MDGLQIAIDTLLRPEAICLVMAGTAAGIVVGAVPGLTGAMLIALTLPLTFSMDYLSAMTLLVSMYVGSVSGGLITATLLRIPGTPASMMTTLDGYPMARDGDPGRALGLGISASLCGGLVSWGFLVFLARPMATLSLKMGPFEFFALVLMALVLIASVSGAALLKGVLAGLLGILAALPGIDPGTFQPRLTLGLVELNGGFKLLPVLIGLFAITQIAQDISELQVSTNIVSLSRRGIYMRLADWKRHAVNLLRSSVIGTWIGILPGIGANIGSVMAYSVARNASRTPGQFGKGCEEGIIASEAANNATVGGALVPLIAMGIPGSVIDAILLGALVIHGLQPGPLLFEYNPEVVYTIMGSVLLANLFMFLFMLLSIGWLARLTSIPRGSLIPPILVFSVVGSFALSNRMFAVWVMLGFGVLGVGLQSLKIPLAPFVIGFVLAPIAEENLVAGL